MAGAGDGPNVYPSRNEESALHTRHASQSETAANNHAGMEDDQLALLEWLLTLEKDEQARAFSFTSGTDC